MKGLIILFFINFSSIVLAFEDNENAIGYWFYKDDKEKLANEKEREVLPPAPPLEAMMEMHPKDLEKLQLEYLDQSVWLLTPEAVLDEMKIRDAIRRKALAYTNVHGMVVMQNPNLNTGAQYPSSTPAINAQTKTRMESIKRKISNGQDEFGLIFFTQNGCQYCDLQRATLGYFNDQHGWEIVEADINHRPKAAVRFNVTTTPMIIMIQRGSDKWMPVSVGYQTLDQINAQIYRAIGLIKGDIDPQQFYLMDYQKTSVKDPLSGNL